MKNQIFILGDCMAYGVGGVDGGLADILKKKLHTKMYKDEGLGEIYEVYDFSKPGTNFDFVVNTFNEQLKFYRRDYCKSIVILVTGAYNFKAKKHPGNYISTADEFKQGMQNLIKRLKAEIDDLLVLGYYMFDETKTMPKISPFDGSESYFSNERIPSFNEELEKICKKEDVKFIKPETPSDFWINNYLFKDGLHPNKKGYELILAEIEKQLELEE